jgi:hypothetical protein
MTRPVRIGAARVLFAVLAVLIVGETSAYACPVCFGAEETPLIDGAKIGILALLVITFVVQGGFVAFFLYLRKRARRIADLDLDVEWSKFQGGVSRS